MATTFKAATHPAPAGNYGVTMERTLHALRCNGWTVAVHNDYSQNGDRYSFWLFTHPCGLYVKGEGLNDHAALTECAMQARRYEGQTSAIYAPEKYNMAMFLADCHHRHVMRKKRKTRR